MSVNYRTDDECMQCMEIAPLLMPVRIFTWGGYADLLLCRDCRLQLKDDHWTHLESTARHRAKQHSQHPTL